MMVSKRERAPATSAAVAPPSALSPTLSPTPTAVSTIATLGVTVAIAATVVFIDHLTDHGLSKFASGAPQHSATKPSPRLCGTPVQDPRPRLQVVRGPAPSPSPSTLSMTRMTKRTIFTCAICRSRIGQWKASVLERRACPGGMPVCVSCTSGTVRYVLISSGSGQARASGDSPRNVRTTTASGTATPAMGPTMPDTNASERIMPCHAC